MDQGKYLLFYCLHQNFDIGMHSDAHEPLWFKLGMIIDTTERLSLILNSVILTLIQGHRDGRNTSVLIICMS